MIWRKSLIRLVSFFVVTTLLWCQTAAAAQNMPAVPATPPAESTQPGPCHSAAESQPGDPDTQQGSHARCQSRDASIETTKIHLPDIHDLLVKVAKAISLSSRGPDTILQRGPVNCAASPPLILVYCRLLN